MTSYSVSAAVEPSTQRHGSLAFADFELDLDQFVLRGPQGVEALQPQVFDLLTYLIRHRDRVVPREELLDEIWGDRFVTPSALSSRIKAVRRAVGDDGQRQAIVRTAHGRGFQFVADVTAVVTDSGVCGHPPFAPVPSTLPLTRGELIGRDEELDRLARLLGSEQLVTIIGPGGVGKTRLAIETARHVAKYWGTTAIFIDLTPLRHPSEVIDEVERVLSSGRSERAGSPTADWARTPPASSDPPRRLIVLDNVEHVVDAAPGLPGLLAAHPDAHLLATSRERLQLRSEVVFPLAPLPVRAEQGSASPARQLFEQAARRADATCDLSSANDDVDAICRAVSGLPLGIELLASQIRVLPPAMIRARAQQHVLSIRSTDSDIPHRHMSIRDAVEWSFSLLPDHLRTVMLRLAVFCAPVSLDDIEDVCLDDGDVVETVTALADRSLLAQRLSDDHRIPMFHLLAPVRAHAEELLEASGDAGPVRRRHAELMATRLAWIEHHRWTTFTSMWRADVSRRFDDIDCAVEFSFSDGDPRQGAAIAARLWSYWHPTSQGDKCRRWALQGLAFEHDVSAADAGRLHLSAGVHHFVHGRHEQAREHWRATEHLFDPDRDLRYRAIAMSYIAGSHLDDPTHREQALELSQAGVQLARSTNETAVVSLLLNVDGELARTFGELDRAEQSYLEARALASLVDDRAQQIVLDYNLSAVAARVSSTTRHSNSRWVASLNRLSSNTMPTPPGASCGLPLQSAGSDDTAKRPRLSAPPTAPSRQSA